ncbi:BOS complex subunit ncln [Trichinella pseudospiralis]
MIEKLIECFRMVLGLFLVTVTCVLPFSSSSISATSANTYDFSVFRLPQFELHGTEYGTQDWRLYYEAVSVNSLERIRRCLVVWWMDVVVDELHSLLSSNLGGIIFVLPANFSTMLAEEKNRFLRFEKTLLTLPTKISLFIAFDCPEIQEVMRLAEERAAVSKRSLFHKFISLCIGENYRLYTGNQNDAMSNNRVLHNIIGRLSAFDQREHVTTIAIVAHYDSFGLTAKKSFGYNSNGSGMVILLELLRLFSRLYKTSTTRAKFNLLFLLAAGGKANYLGTKQWIDDLLERRDRYTAAPLIDFAICLDGLISEDSKLYMHVSKVPRQNSSMHRFYQMLEQSGKNYNVSTAIVQKKINLGDELLLWEHERFSLRRIYAHTLSGIQSPFDPMRRSILDLDSEGRFEKFVPIAMTVVEGLFRYLYGMKNGSVEHFLDPEAMRDHWKMWLDYLKRTPRSTQLLPNFTETQLGRDIVRFFEHFALETSIGVVTSDIKLPDFIFYNGFQDVVHAHLTKSAFFDLLSSVFIVGYLWMLHLLALNVQRLYLEVGRHVGSLKFGVFESLHVEEEEEEEADDNEQLSELSWRRERMTITTTNNNTSSSSWSVMREEMILLELVLFPGKSMLENAITRLTANEPIESVTQSERSGRAPVLDRILMEHKVG